MGLREKWRAAARFVSLLVSLTLPLAAADAAQIDIAEGRWRMLATPRYTVVSQLSEQETRAWAREFDLFIAAASQLVRADTRQLPKTTVVLFSRNDGFTPYKPRRPDGTHALNVVGVFSRRPSWGVIGVAGDARSEESRRTIYHEATHWIMSTDASARPKWFEEGIAETLSSFQVKDDGVRWGTAIQSHINVAAHLPRVPSQRLFNLDDDDPLFNDDDRTGTFYVTSWAVVHYLVFGSRPESRKGLTEFLRLYQTKSPDEAFSKAFGIQYAQFDEELRAYVNNGKYGILNVRPPLVPDDAVMTTPTPAQVHAALGRLALATGNPDLARKHADRSLSLDPTQPAVREIRALLAARDKDEEQSRLEARLAVRLGSRDAEMLALVASGSASARERADNFERALMMSPRFMRGYVGLLQALHELEHPTATDRSFIELGRKAFPHAGIMLLGLSELAWKDGDAALSKQLLDEAADPGMNTPEWMLASIRQLQAQ